MATSFYASYGKRMLDLFVAVTGLICLAPLIVALYLGSWLFLGRPVFFSQVRGGRHNRPFTIWKFRSMLDLRDEKGNPLPDEERLVPYGRFLRHTSLDELPNLLGVVQGHVSLVGPRPLPPHYTRYYTPEQARRLTVTPGLVGLAGLHGRNAQSWERIFHWDTTYAANVTFGNDLRIIFKMIGVILSRKGVDRGHHNEGSPFAERLQRGEEASVASSRT